MADPAVPLHVPLHWRAALGPRPHQREGRAEGAAGVALREQTGFALFEVCARPGQGEGLAARLGAAFGLPVALPRTGLGDARAALLWSGPGRWRLLGTPGRLDRATLAAACAGGGWFTDRRGGFGWISVSGPAAAEALGRAVPVDLHPRTFGFGDVVLTTADHIPLQIWQSAPAPCYELLFPRSSAGSFWAWLIDQTAGFGVAVG